MIYAACANDNFRKPCTGVWDLIEKDYAHTCGAGVKKEESYLVGDSAGRESDHTDADWHFSLNVELRFHTPEEFFLSSEVEERGDKFNPLKYLPNSAAGGGGEFLLST